MAQRRDDDWFELLIGCPWQVSVGLGVAVYGSMNFLLPNLEIQNPLLRGMLQRAPELSWVSMLFLIPALLSLIRSERQGELLEKQSGLDSIRKLSWKQFEELLAEVYRRQSFQVIENVGVGADGGIDLTLRKNEKTYLVQAKQWKAWKVGVRVVREMFGLMHAHRADGVIVVTSGQFTAEAQEFAVGKPIELIAGERLAELVRSVQDFRPDQPIASAPPSVSSSRRECPRCRGTLVVRTARRGSQIGQPFWGCSKYPACRYTEPCES